MKKFEIFQQDGKWWIRNPYYDANDPEDTPSYGPYKPKSQALDVARGLNKTAKNNPDIFQ